MAFICKEKTRGNIYIDEDQDVRIETAGGAVGPHRMNYLLYLKNQSLLFFVETQYPDSEKDKKKITAHLSRSKKDEDFLKKNKDEIKNVLSEFLDFLELQAYSHRLSEKDMNEKNLSEELHKSTAYEIIV